MNPADHEARTSSPFIERAESAGVVDDAFILPSTPVAAASVVGDVPSVLPRRHLRMSWAARQWARLRAVTS